MEEVKSYKIRYTVFSTTVCDSPAHPHKHTLVESYVLTNEKPIPGKKIKAHFYLPHRFDAVSGFIESDVNVKIPKTALVSEMIFDEF